MPQTNKANDYLGEVCSHIRWKRARGIVRKELEAHIEDQQEAFAAKGMDGAAASDKAVEEMGDAAMVGSLLDRSYRPKPAWSVIAITAILMLVGYLSRMYIISQYDGYFSLHNFQPEHSVFWLIAAVAVLVAGYFLDFTILIKYSRVLRVLYYAVLAVLIFEAFSRGYIYVLKTFANYFLMLFPVVYTGILCSVTDKSYRGFIACCVYLAVAVFSGFVVPSLVSAMLCWLIGLFLLSYAIIKGFFKINRLLGLLIIYLPSALLFGWLLNAGVRDRIRIALHPELEPFGAGFLTLRIREILNYTQLLGAGSHTYDGYFLPDNASDFFLVFLTYKLGWISFIVITALFVLLFVVLSVLISRQKNTLGRMVAASVFLVLFAEFSVYTMNNLGYYIVGSMTLPLVSYGNSALIVNSFLIGLMLSVFRAEDLILDSKTDRAAMNAGNGNADTLYCFQIKIAVSMRYFCRPETPSAFSSGILSRLRFPVISCRFYRDITEQL